MRKIDSIEIHKCSIARLIPRSLVGILTPNTFMMSHSVKVSNGGQWEDKSSSNHVKLLYHFSFNSLTYYLLVYLLHFLHWAILITPCLLFLSWRVAHTMEQAASNSPIMHWYNYTDVQNHYYFAGSWLSPTDHNVICSILYDIYVHLCSVTILFSGTTNALNIVHKTVLHAAKLSLPRDCVWGTRN